jgi:aryl-alcohol dehydrogenase (NADP+)
MQRRALGRTSIEVSRIGLGCVTFGREIDEAASFAVLDIALEAGINLLDTAEAYGGGQSFEGRRAKSGSDDVREATTERHSSELILGRWLADRGCRGQVVIQTKVTPPLGRQRIIESAEASLRRLQTDFIDVFMLHAFDARTPIDETFDALSQLVRAGKARTVGCSNFSAEQLAGMPARAMAVTQFNYNLAVREAEASLFDLCRARGIGVETYSPLAAGFLTGKYNTRVRDLPRGSRFDLAPAHADVYFHDENFRVVDRLAALAARSGIPAARLAMAWVLQRPEIDCVLFGARHGDHVQNAVEALGIRFDPAWNRMLIGPAPK